MDKWMTIVILSSMDTLTRRFLTVTSPNYSNCSIRVYSTSRYLHCRVFEQSPVYIAEPHLSLVLLQYLGTSIVWKAKISHVACSLLTVMKFGLDENTRREPKCCYLLI